MNGAKLDPSGLPRTGTSTSPVAVFVPSLQARAMAFHRQTYGSGCECFDAGLYPCADCRTEIVELVTLLDRVAVDAIDITTRAWQQIR